MQILFSSSLIFLVIGTGIPVQTDNTGSINPQLIISHDSQINYSGVPNHREIVLRSFDLAVEAGFLDTNGITIQEIRDRLEAGAYSEDFEDIPGIIGEHFPAPWSQGPDFDFLGYYPFTKIPYGSYRDTSSGWYRGLNHGYDPVQNFKWPGAKSTTVDWANYPGNSHIWYNAVQLYISGEKAKAYQCLGHLLHLLADLSIPSHVRVVNHGMDVVELKSGTLLNPDKLELTIDEYELALSGGILVQNIIIIPDLLTEFRSALNLASPSNVPVFVSWEDYLRKLGEYTYLHPLVNQFYAAPAWNGGWGAALDQNGVVKNPITYATLPLAEINGSWFELKIKSTAGSNGTVLPKAKMVDLCRDLVPKAVEHGAGLIRYFHQIVTDVRLENSTPGNFLLSQNYPNPFNAGTVINYSVPGTRQVQLKIFDILGNEVENLVDEVKPAGTYEITWNAANFPSGVYFYQLRAATGSGMAESFMETRKMILIK